MGKLVDTAEQYSCQGQKAENYTCASNSKDNFCFVNFVFSCGKLD